MTLTLGGLSLTLASSGAGPKSVAYFLSCFAGTCLSFLLERIYEKQACRFFDFDEFVCDSEILASSLERGKSSGWAERKGGFFSHGVL